MALVSIDGLIMAALLGLPRADTLETLRELSILQIKEILKCTDTDTMKVLDDLVERGVIEATITQAGEIADQEPIRRATWYWNPRITKS